jgi:uncharacterized membrane protein YkvA (DUF1232 family)
MDEDLDGRARRTLDAGARRITEADLERIFEKQAEIEKKFAADGPLGRFVADVKLLISMVRDYGSGSYRQVPWLTIASVAATLLYVINPADLIPDVVPVLGLLDDVAIVALCLSMIERELLAYKEWKIAQVKA